MNRSLLRFALTSFFLLLFGSVGVSATDVGGSGGYGTFNYSYSGCGSTHHVWTGSQRYRAHFQADLPEGQASLGAEAGLTVANRWDHAYEDADEETPRIDKGVSVSRGFRLHLLPRVGYHGRYVDFRMGVGASWPVGPGAELGFPILPVGSYEIRAGKLGVLAYYGRGEFYDLTPADWSMAHGVSVLGGDRPSIHAAVRFGVVMDSVGMTGFTESALTFIEIGFAPPRHWKVRPSLRASIGPTEDLNKTSFDVHAELTVVIGRNRARWSETDDPRGGQTGPD